MSQVQPEAHAGQLDLRVEDGLRVLHLSGRLDGGAAEALQAGWQS